jgi:hypothetical protein
MLQSQKLKRKLVETKPQYALFSECIRKHQLEVPVFDKIMHKGMVVSNQKLSTEQCLAIMRGCATREAGDQIS